MDSKDGMNTMRMEMKLITKILMVMNAIELMMNTAKKFFIRILPVIYLKPNMSMIKKEIFCTVKSLLEENLGLATIKRGA